MMKNDLLLRPLSGDDVTPEYIAWLNDPEITQYLGIRHKKENFHREDVVGFIEDCLRLHRFHWGVFFKGRHIGNVSCSAWSNENRWIDISFIIGDKTVYGKGIATLSVAAAISYLFALGEYKRVQSHAVIENKSSIRVMQKVGMKHQ